MLSLECFFRHSPVMLFNRNHAVRDLRNRLHQRTVNRVGGTVTELAVFSHADMNGAHLLALGHAAEDLARDIGQQGIGEDVVHVARAAFHFRAAVGDLFEKCIVIGQLDLVILQQTTLNLAQLEANDLLQRLVAHRVIGNQHHAAQERRLEDLVQLRLQAHR